MAHLNTDFFNSKNRPNQVKLGLNWNCKQDVSSHQLLTEESRKMKSALMEVILNVRQKFQ